MNLTPLRIMLKTAGLLFLLLTCGCATTVMKGTPFFSGEYANTQGRPEDRVNLWPLAYYSDPALSVLWPMGEHTDTSLAFRPLLSLYRDNPGEPYSEFNVLWPLSHFDLKHDEYHIFPVFWGKDYTVVFPLYWHLRDTDSLFPLWIYDNYGDSGYSLDLLWPIFYYRDTTDKHTLRAFPLFSHSHNDTSSSTSTWWLAGLGGVNTRPDTTAFHWLLPFYAYDSKDSSFYSLAYSRFGDTTAIPSLLSWQTADPNTGTKDFYTLGGLFHQRYNAPEGESRGWLFPLYSYDNEEGFFYTLLYGHWDGSSQGRYFTPFIGYKNNARYQEHEHWFFPFYSHETRNEEFKGDLLEHARAIHRKGREYYTGNTGHHSETRLLLGILHHSDHSQRFGKWHTSLAKIIKDRDPKADGEPFSYTERSFNHFILWQDSTEKDIIFNKDITAIKHDGTLKESSLLFFLYDYKHESSQSENHDYTRRRVLWRIMHYEKLNGDVSLDIFPAIAWDAKADGSRKASFLWRFFRYEKPVEGSTKLDLLFIPILR